MDFNNCSGKINSYCSPQIMHCIPTVILLHCMNQVGCTFVLVGMNSSGKAACQTLNFNAD